MAYAAETVACAGFKCTKSKYTEERVPAPACVNPSHYSTIVVYHLLWRMVVDNFATDDPDLPGSLTKPLLCYAGIKIAMLIEWCPNKLVDDDANHHLAVAGACEAAGAVCVVVV